MTGAWDFAGQPPVAGDGVTILEGASFCVSDPNGDIAPHQTAGLFVRDARVLSRWQFDLLPDHLEPLAHRSLDPTTAMFLARRRPAHGESGTSVMISRSRHVSQGMRETIRVHNLQPVATRVVPVLQVAADFADVLAIKSGEVVTRRPVDSTADPEGLWFGHSPADSAGPALRVRVSADHGAIVLPGQLLWDLDLAPGAITDLRIDVMVEVNGVMLPRSPEPVRRHASSVQRPPRLQVITPDDDLERIAAQSLTDLAALRMVDPIRPDRPIVAAGAPWFMTLFGRDSLLTSWMLLPFSPELTAGTLGALADRQGVRTDPATEEQPGRILHEVRSGSQTTAALAGTETYYGSADATPLFVMLVGEWSRWGATDDELAPLLPHVDRALEWITGPGDPDGDGFVEVSRMTDRGLVNQGWKDSPDAIAAADGQIPHGPIALCEVQAYVYGAYLARAELAERFGARSIADEYRDRATVLKDRFNRMFWLPDRGFLAIGLTGGDQPIDACGSNMGHALWTGIVADEHAAAVAARLTDPTMFSGWGVRTLATDMRRFNPAGYHNGTVWPHDSAIIAAGLMRYGFVEHAMSILAGLLDAAVSFDGRLPEVFCGFSRHEFPFPVPFPTSCAPQAWAAAAPLLGLRALLGLAPDVPRGTVRLSPRVPRQLQPLTIRELIIAGNHVNVTVEADVCTVTGLPDWLTLDQPSADVASAVGH